MPIATATNDCSADLDQVLEETLGACCAVAQLFRARDARSFKRFSVLLFRGSDRRDPIVCATAYHLVC